MHYREQVTQSESVHADSFRRLDEKTQALIEKTVSEIQEGLTKTRNELVLEIRVSEPHSVTTTILRYL